MNIHLEHHKHHQEQDHNPHDYDPARAYAERTEQDYGANPVAVQIVDAEPIRVRDMPTRQWTTGSISVVPGASPVQVIGSNPFRDALWVRCGTGGTVYIGPHSDTLTPTSGWPIPAGEPDMLRTRESVWVVADPGNTGPVMVAFRAEHVDG